MQRITGRCVLFAAIAAAAMGCGSGSGEAVDAGQDAGPDVDSGSDAGDTDTDTGTGTGEDDTPPALPDSCRLEGPQQPVSGAGDGREPSAAFIETAGDPGLFVWSYFGDEAGAVWTLQAATVDVPELDAGVDGGADGGEPSTALGDVFEPVNRGVVAQDPVLAARGDDELGLVWRDGRWDTTCVPTNPQSCQRSLAFVRLDVNGQAADSPQPVQLTIDEHVASRPALLATDAGYVALWNSSEGQAFGVRAMAFDAEGKAGAVQEVSGPAGVDRFSAPAAAKNGGTIAVVWNSPDQRRLFARLLDESAAPLGEPSILDDGVVGLGPRIAAAGDGFLVAWARRPQDGMEVYTQRLGADGALVGAPERVTWSSDPDVELGDLTANGATFALTWLTTRASGSTACAVETCDQQVFLTALDGQGKAASAPVMLSDDPNDCQRAAVAWDGGGWTAIWQITRDLRYRVFYARTICE